MGRIHMVGLELDIVVRNCPSIGLIKINKLAIVVAFAALSQSGTVRSAELNAKQYMKQHGWEPFEARHTAKAPNSDIAPVLYYESDDSVPSCALVSSIPGTKEPRFTELMRAPKGEDFPQCVAVVAMQPFKLNAKEYLAVEYVVRDTREDLYRNFAFLSRDHKQGYMLDATLSKLAPIKVGDLTSMLPNSSRASDGVKIARAASVKQAFSQWRFHERDFIADKVSSFAVFDDSKAQQCYVVTEAGGSPVVASAADFVPGTQCAGVLAASRLEKRAVSYYIALLNSSAGTKVAVITSVNADGVIRVEKELAERVNNAGATRDIRTIKAVLATYLK